MHLQMSILRSGTPIHCHYVGALLGSREKLIELHGKWCYTLTKKALAEYGMITLCAQADIYRQCMDYFLDQKMDVNSVLGVGQVVWTNCWAQQASDVLVLGEWRAAVGHLHQPDLCSSLMSQQLGAHVEPGQW